MNNNTVTLFPEIAVDPLLDARRILHEAVEQYRPTRIFAAYSSGHDSLTSTYLAFRELGVTDVFNVDTTTAIPESLRQVEKNCDRFGWKLHRYRPPVPYDQIVMEHGFPGPGQHPTMYARLKERCVRKLRHDFKKDRKDTIMLITGVRKAESKRRMGSVKEIQKDGSIIWVAPATNWSNDARDAYIADNNLPRSPVSTQMCMSGECMCGCYARPEEESELKAFDRDHWQWLQDLKARVRAAGKWWKWGEAPPTPPDPLQLDMGLCWSCESKTEAT